MTFLQEFTFPLYVYKLKQIDQIFFIYTPFFLLAYTNFNPKISPFSLKCKH